MYSEGSLLEATNITRRLREAAGLIDVLGFEFTKVDVGRAEGRLPLSSTSANQHGTQLGLVMGIVADFVGGLALASLFPEEPILGIHEVEPDRAMCLWTLESAMKFQRPAADDLVFKSALDPSMHDAIRQRYNAGMPVVVELSVEILDSTNTSVATSEFKYFARQKSAIQASAAQGKHNVMFDYFMKSSARLIASLRAMEDTQMDPLFRDPFASVMASRQGHLMAERFLKDLPELQSLVAGRTHHGNVFIADGGFEQVVFLGVGFDTRMYCEGFPGVPVFEVDLPQMLAERERKLGESGVFSSNARRVPVNLLVDSISGALAQHDFDPTAPTAFIFEGCTMYFTAQENERILAQVRELLSSNPQSRLWMDAVDESLLKRGGPENVERFLKGMARLGEPFVFGLSESTQFFEALGLRVNVQKNASAYARGLRSELFELYRFYVLSA